MLHFLIDNFRELGIVLGFVFVGLVCHCWLLFVVFLLLSYCSGGVMVVGCPCKLAVLGDSLRSLAVLGDSVRQVAVVSGFCWRVLENVSEHWR